MIACGRFEILGRHGRRHGLGAGPQNVAGPWLGDLRALDHQDLAYALVAPLAQARLLWLHADATAQDRRTALDRGARHAELFASAVFGPGQQHHLSPQARAGT